jgi:MoaA/NifB/PqqE/SkfB family radical SAM enzyme
MYKTRILPNDNYRAIFVDGKTYRFAIDDSKPIAELEYPEFLDVKITNFCEGHCPYCYQNSTKVDDHFTDIVYKVKQYFGNLTPNQRPFQVAIGGGEPTTHPDFIELLKTFYDLGIMPNYTTNGMNLNSDIIQATKKYCGGVAVSCHSHLVDYWINAIHLLSKFEIFINLHLVIKTNTDIDIAFWLKETYKHKIKYIVLLPYVPIGRAAPIKEYDLIKERLFDRIIKHKKEGESIEIFAFGAGFHSDLVKHRNEINASLYEPEHFSKYLDLKDMKLYKSSFEVTPIN